MFRECYWTCIQSYLTISVVHTNGLQAVHCQPLCKVIHGICIWCMMVYNHWCVADINELSLPKTCQIDFPDPNELLTFKLSICPDEVAELHLYISPSCCSCICGYFYLHHSVCGCVVWDYIYNVSLSSNMVHFFYICVLTAVTSLWTPKICSV